MTTTNACCGSYVQRKQKTIKTPLLPNPKVQSGVAVIYLGTGNISVKGSETGSVYHASDHNRHFRVYREDAASILRNSYMIIKP